MESTFLTHFCSQLWLVLVRCFKTVQPKDALSINVHYRTSSLNSKAKQCPENSAVVKWWPYASFVPQSAIGALKEIELLMPLKLEQLKDKWVKRQVTQEFIILEGGGFLFPSIDVVDCMGSLFLGLSLALCGMLSPILYCRYLLLI